MSFVMVNLSSALTYFVRLLRRTVLLLISALGLSCPKDPSPNNYASWLYLACLLHRDIVWLKLGIRN